ncbi:peptidase [Candidatus Blochmanniella vafra str. BVAF]|uniref:Peptidase n=1 Tax=Blochmanniella vafra (strain BVAF) TaxID=859654 RepID=E8Q717_BLOVB|nr:murein DD-endopeptidase MepM [Candidatus Blochmannia vafer]ADV33841.1 peptidase [Candidatus Blochmannia vafer str. BVAF]
MYGIVCNSIKLICRCLYKRYSIIVPFVFIIIIIIMIVWNMFLLSYEFNKNDYNQIIAVQKSTLCSFFKTINNNTYVEDNLFFLNILKKQVSQEQSLKIFSMNDYSRLFSNNTLTQFVEKYNRNLVNIDEVYLLTQQYPVLDKLRIGQSLLWLIVNQKRLQCLIWGVSEQEIRLYNKKMNAYFNQGIIKVLKKNSNEKKQCYTVLFSGSLHETFVDSARSLGLEENCIVDVVNALRYQLDFKKLHSGDKFALLVSLIFDIKNNNIYSELIGARVRTAGQDYYIFKANNGRFYNKEAVGSINKFIRLPILKPYRISSNFNMNRLNPVTGQVTQHVGVDFAVPVGTPVLSIGDGVVLSSKYSKIAGNYVVIKHDFQCITRYMHLKKILVKSGQRVSRGDSIALSGNTGRSTGPHLHFEVWINRQPVNPLTTSILNVEKLLGNDRIKYLKQINEIIPKLNFD